MRRCDDQRVVIPAARDANMVTKVFGGTLERPADAPTCRLTSQYNEV